MSLFKKIADSYEKNKPFVACSINSDNTVDYNGEDFLMSDDSEEGRCPHCGNQNNNPIHFRISSAFTNRILSDIVLDQTDITKEQKEQTLYKGRKYISFTDSRQGTAKISALINIDSESDWIRYQVYHYLLNRLNTNQVDASEDELLKERAKLIIELETVLPFRKAGIQKDIDLINSLLNINYFYYLILSNFASKETKVLTSNPTSLATAFCIAFLSAIRWLIDILTALISGESFNSHSVAD